MKHSERPPLPFFPMLLLIMLLLLMAGPFPSFAGEIPLDRIVATVNHTVVTQTELEQATADAERQMLATGIPVPDKDALKRQILDQMIDMRLQLQIASEAGLAVSSADVDAAVDQIAARNGISTLELYQKIGEQGLIADEWRKTLHDQILVQKVQQQAVGPTITLTPDEVEAFAKTPEARHLSEKEIRQQLFEQKYQKAVKQWIALNRTQAAIQLNLNA